MPRRNQRETYEPLDLTPADIRKGSYEVATRFAKSRDPRAIRADHEREDIGRMERQRDARISGGIDWTICVVPGCGGELVFWGRTQHSDPDWRDHKVRLPMCVEHLSVVFEQAKLASDQNHEVFVEANMRIKERKEAINAAKLDSDKRAHLARTDGMIYVLRLNGLIKVGWSRTVWQRLRAYGPDVEILCVYPGRRADETNLHRQLTPVRARGREWYHDGPVIADFVSKMVDEWGAPDPAEYDSWTRPKQIIAGKRVR